MVKGSFWKFSKKIARFRERTLQNPQDFLEDLGRLLAFFF
jgi:hypothetical protein